MMTRSPYKVANRLACPSSNFSHLSLLVQATQVPVTQRIHTKFQTEIPGSMEVRL